MSRENLWMWLFCAKIRELPTWQTWLCYKKRVFCYEIWWWILNSFLKIRIESIFFNNLLFKRIRVLWLAWSSFNSKRLFIVSSLFTESKVKFAGFNSSFALERDIESDCEEVVKRTELFVLPLPADYFFSYFFISSPFMWCLSTNSRFSKLSSEPKNFSSRSLQDSTFGNMSSNSETTCLHWSFFIWIWDFLFKILPESKPLFCTLLSLS